MKRLLLASAIALLPMQAFAVSLGYQQATSISTGSAANLPTIPSNAGSALVSVENSGIRWRDDATDPTSTVGMPLSAGQYICYAQELAKFRVIGQAAGANVNVTYYAGKGCAQ